MLRFNVKHPVEDLQVGMEIMLTQHQYASKPRYEVIMCKEDHELTTVGNDGIFEFWKIGFPPVAHTPTNVVAIHLIVMLEDETKEIRI